MTIYSQRDPRWRALKVGTDGRSMAQIGCVITSIAMLSTYFKPDRTPDDILKQARFTYDGKIIWSTLLLDGFKFYWRVYIRENERIIKHIKHPDLAVILEVADKTHWVVATGKNWLTGTYKIADPLFGDLSTMKRYQDKITGAAYFKRV